MKAKIETRYVANADRRACDINAAFKCYIEEDRAQRAAPSATDLAEWRQDARKSAGELLKALGSQSEARWIALQLGLSEAALPPLKDSLEVVIKGPPAPLFHDSGRKDMAKWALFHRLARIYEDLHEAPFTRTVDTDDHAVSGAAMAWVVGLFRQAAAHDEAPREVVDLAAWADNHPQALAKQIQDHRSELEAGRRLVAALEAADQGHPLPQRKRTRGKHA